MSNFSSPEIEAFIKAMQEFEQENRDRPIPRPVFLVMCREQWKATRKFGGVTLNEAVSIMTLSESDFLQWVDA